MFTFAYVSILDSEALAGMRADVLTATASVLGVVIAIVAVGFVIKVLIK